MYSLHVCRQRTHREPKELFVLPLDIDDLGVNGISVGTLLLELPIREIHNPPRRLQGLLPHALVILLLEDTGVI